MGKQRCLPRMRGDPPYPSKLFGNLGWSTPHARGSTHGTSEYREATGVYPACAGIHPWRRSAERQPLRLPRMRGDPPVNHVPYGVR